MRHSPARRSVLGQVGRKVRLADHAHEPPRRGAVRAARNAPQTHRALRLAIAVCAAGAGFCLVLAMVTLVVALNGTSGPPVTVRRSAPPRAKVSAPSTPRRPAVRHGPAAPASHWTLAARQVVPDTSYLRYGTSAGRISASYQYVAEAKHFKPAAPEAQLASKFAVATTVALYRGTGPGKLRSFRIAAPGEWGISWDFRCASQRPGSFGVHETGGESPKGLTVSAFGPNGRGLSWTTLDPGTHELAVSTGCSWVVRIVAP